MINKLNTQQHNNKVLLQALNRNSQDQKSSFTPVMQEAMFKAEWKGNWDFSQSGFKLIGDSRGSFFHKEEVFLIHPVEAYRFQKFKSSGIKTFFFWSRQHLLQYYPSHLLLNGRTKTNIQVKNLLHFKKKVHRDAMRRTLGGVQMQLKKNKNLLVYLLYIF